MKHVCALVCLALLLAVSLTRPAVSAQRSAQEEGPDKVPETLSLYVREHFPGLSIPSKEDLYRPGGEGFGAKTKQTSPFVCSGDFNGDVLTDVALLLRDNAKGTLTLVAFHQTSKGGYTHFVIQAMQYPLGGKLYHSISCQKPGKKQEVEGPAIHVRHDSIALYNFEGSKELFYFEKNGYRSIIIGD